jgi:hypothetical protein
MNRGAWIAGRFESSPTLFYPALRPIETAIPVVDAAQSPAKETNARAIPNLCWQLSKVDRVPLGEPIGLDSQPYKHINDIPGDRLAVYVSIVRRFRGHIDVVGSTAPRKSAGRIEIIWMALDRRRRRSDIESR